jgi:hypothetical protein
MHVRVRTLTGATSTLVPHTGRASEDNTSHGGSHRRGAARMTVIRLSEARVKLLEKRIGELYEKIDKSSSDKQKARYRGTLRRLLKDYDRARMVKAREGRR